VNPIISKRALIALSLVALTAACDKDKDKDKDESGDDAKKSTATATAQPTAAATPTATAAATAVAVVPDTGGGLARAELDGKEPDAGWSGGTLVVNKLTFTTPKDWKTSSGDFNAAVAADGSSGFAAGKYPDGAAPVSLRDAAAKAIGLTECAWGTADSISLGKDKLAAQAADGTCKRDGKPAKAIFAATAGKDMNVLAVGSFDEGKDMKPVVNTFRSAKGANVGPAVAGNTDPSGLAACCAAIRQNKASAPPMMQGAYAAAEGACFQAMKDPQGKAALGAIRGMLSMAGGAPASCR